MTRQSVNMATDLSSGSIPPLYREIYDIVSPHQEQIDQDLFVRVLVKSSLPRNTLIQIWNEVDNKQGSLNRNGLYKALALTALAQQGKNINDKILETYSGQELPKPTLGDLTDLKSLCIRIRRERTPNILGYRYEELGELDTIKVELVPEKKGLILKHVEYEVTSRRYKTTVLRRYNDFVAFYELLLLRFPYRMIPRLPPKKMMGGNREFIEHRRKSLRRFLNLVARHPTLHDDRLVKFFLSFSGSEMQHKIKEHFRGMPDEFMTNELALKAKELVPMDTQMQFGSARQHVKTLQNAVTRLRDIAERMAIRNTSYASDMLHFGKELSGLSNDTTTVSSWASGNNDSWSHLKRGFKQLSVEYAALADKASTQAIREEESVTEELNIFLDILESYRDMCDRQEKGVVSDHQRALQKMGQYKKKKMSATIQGPSEAAMVEQLEQRILQQESHIANMEYRNYFSLYCVQMETQLIHANLVILHNALMSMTRIEHTGLSELANVWEHLKPIADNIIIIDSRNGSATNTPIASPLASPTANHAGITI